MSGNSVSGGAVPSGHGSEQLALPLPESPELPLDTYSEADDVATRFFDTPRPDPNWIVQVTLFDRRVMSTAGLLGELRSGRLVHGSTPVWRGGMPDWRAAAYVEELQSAAPFPVVATPRAARRRSSTPAAGAWLCGAAALLTLSLTLYALASAGVFDPSASGALPSPSVAASLQAH